MERQEAPTRRLRGKANVAAFTTSSHCSVTLPPVIFICNVIPSRSRMMPLLADALPCLPGQEEEDGGQHSRGTDGLGNSGGQRQASSAVTSCRCAKLRDALENRRIVWATVVERRGRATVPSTGLRGAGVATRRRKRWDTLLEGSRTHWRALPSVPMPPEGMANAPKIPSGR